MEMIDSALESLAGPLFLKMKIDAQFPALLSAPSAKQQKNKRHREIMLRGATLQVNKEEMGNSSHQFQTLALDV